MKFGVVWQICFWTAFVWSGYLPYDRATWWMEIVPALIGYAVLMWTRKKFPLPKMLYVFILLHAIVLMIGGKYTYARVPYIGDFALAMGLHRNPYDGIGHFMQGFVPALIAREIFVRKKVIKSAGWMFFLTVCVCLAISAAYELIEWSAAMAMGKGADDFLGTQGDPWDTQKDMLFAVIGALVALLCFSRAFLADDHSAVD